MLRSQRIARAATAYTTAPRTAPGHGRHGGGSAADATATPGQGLHGGGGRHGGGSVISLVRRHGIDPDPALGQHSPSYPDNPGPHDDDIAKDTIPAMEPPATGTGPASPATGAALDPVA